MLEINSAGGFMMFEYWGKASRELEGGCHLLVFHCLDCAAVATTLLANEPLLVGRVSDCLGATPRVVRDFIAFWACLHDLGKFSPAFQNKVPELMRQLQGSSWPHGSTLHHTDLGLLAWGSWLRQTWGERGWFGFHPPGGTGLMASWAQAGFAHHGCALRPPALALRDPFQCDNLFPAESRAAGQELADWAARRFGADRPLVDQFEEETLEARLARCSWLAAGVIVAADWISSNSDFFQPQSQPMDMDQYWESALDQAGRALRQSGLLPAPVASFEGVETLFSHIAQPTPMQTWAAECRLPAGPKLIILEESTGSGKTEAAMILAQRILAAGEAEALFVGLPTMATANAMYSRLAGVYRRLFRPEARPSLALAHSRSALHREFTDSLNFGPADSAGTHAILGGQEPQSTAECAAWLAQGNKRSLLASLGVGTVDQALMAAMPVRHQCLRLLGLSRSVVIIDEVHSYDTYVSSLLARGLLPHLAFLGQTVILLSATLNSGLRRQLIDGFYGGLEGDREEEPSQSYPLATLASARGVLQAPLETREQRRVSFAVELIDDQEQVMREIERAAAAGGCVCWVRNTVDDARESFQELRGRLGPERVGLLHARFALCDRLAAEDRVLDRFGPASQAEDRAGLVLVATQVVEQSLDLDFDLMISDLAPVDLLLQRAGRLHRHQRDNRPVAEPRLVVHGPLPADDPPDRWFQDFFPRGAWVYQRHGLLWLTAKALAAMGAVRLPRDVRPLVERVYVEQEPPPGLAEWEDRAQSQDQAAGFIAGENVLRWDEGYQAGFNSWGEDTPTRLSEEVTRIYLGRWEGGRLSPWSGEEGWRGWEMSQVTINRRKVSGPADTGDRELAEAKRRMLKRFPWVEERGNVVLPLEAGPDGGWRATAINARNDLLNVWYHPSMGLVAEPA